MGPTDGRNLRDDCRTFSIDRRSTIEARARKAMVPGREGESKGRAEAAGPSVFPSGDPLKSKKLEVLEAVVQGAVRIMVLPESGCMAWILVDLFRMDVECQGSILNGETIFNTDLHLQSC